MGIIVDIIIVAAIALFTFLGYKKGLIGMAFSVASFLVAIVVAFILFNPVANIIMDNTELDENIKNAIIENFSGEAEQAKESENMPDIIVNYIQEKTTDMKNAGVATIAVSISEICVKALAFIGVFVVARIILTIIEKIADVIAKLPIIKQFNKGGGLILGALKGIVIVYIVFAILSFVSPIFSDSSIYSTINDTMLAKFMYNDNLILKIFF